jgi:hypothetical protein
MAHPAFIGEHFGATLLQRCAIGGNSSLRQSDGQHSNEGQTQGGEHKKTTLKIHAFASKANANTEGAEAMGFGRLRAIVGGRRLAGFALPASCVGGSAKVPGGCDQR